MSASMPIMSSRTNNNRFSFDMPSDHSHPTYVSPLSTSNSSANYGSLSPSPPDNQHAFMQRGYSSLSAPRSSLPFHEGRYDQSTPNSYPIPGEPDPYYYPSFATPPRPSKKKTAPKKADGKQPTFLTKLYAILETPEYHRIIRWDDEGTVIVIEKPDELADKILPLVYRQSRFASFSRQLNIYGWMRKVSLRHVEKGIVDPDASTWSHTFLNRESSRDELINFKRRVPPRPSQSQASRARADPSAVTGEMDYASDTYSSPDAYHQHLFDEQYAHPSMSAFQPHHHMQQSMFQSSPTSHGVLASPLAPIDRARPAPIAISPMFSQMNPNETLYNNSAQQYHQQQQQHIPQTAPLHNTLISTPVTEGHNRTRSYQCNSPLNPNIIPSGTSAPHQVSSSSNQPKTLAMSWKPLFNPLDPSSWARRGYTDFQGNLMPLSASVPANFGTSQQSPLSTPPQGQGQSQGQLPNHGHENNQNQSQHNGFQSQWTPSPPEHPFSAAMSVDSSPTTPVMEGTISPAIFRPGYAPPPGTTGTPTSSNGGVPMPNTGNLSGGSTSSHNRRPSYPPPALIPQGPVGTRPHFAGHSRTLSLGEQVQIKFPPLSSTRRASEMEGILDSTPFGQQPEKKSRMDEERDTLPSAALKGLLRMPFEGILPEQDEPMT